MERMGGDRRSGKDRRRRATGPISRFMLSGRRRLVRRRDERKIHPYVDRYEPGLLLSVLVILLLSILDVYLTMFHLDRGAWEVNPFMKVLLGYGDFTFFAIKYGLTTLGLLILCVLKNLSIVRVVLRGILAFYVIVLAYHVALILRG